MTNKYKWIILIVTVLLLIIVPFCIWGEQIDKFVVVLIEKGQEYPVKVGILLAALLAGDIVLPTPSSIISTGSGAVLGFFWGTLVSFIGMTVSCVLGYFIGRYASEHFVKRLMGNTMKSLEMFGNRYGRWCLLVTRAVPILAEASVLFAGLGKQKFSKFFVITTMANFVISLLYAYIGSNAVSKNAFLLVFAGGILIPGIFMLMSKLFTQRKM
jgi:uncharacterized membrane protein YdjX (TVP38/TMEM64 family)